MSNTQLSISLKPALREALKREADAQECSVSWLVRKALRDRFMPASSSRDQGSSNVAA